MLQIAHIKENHTEIQYLKKKKLCVLYVILFFDTKTCFLVSVSSINNTQATLASNLHLQYYNMSLKRTLFFYKIELPNL